MTAADTAVVSVNANADGGIGGYDTATLAGVRAERRRSEEHGGFSSDKSFVNVVADGGYGGYGDGAGSTGGEGGLATVGASAATITVANVSASAQGGQGGEGVNGANGGAGATETLNDDVRGARKAVRLI